MSIARGLVPILQEQRGFAGLNVLTDPSGGESIIVSLWEMEADAEASETGPSYVGQMSMMSSFLYEPLVPKTYEVSVLAYSKAVLGVFFGLRKLPSPLENPRLSALILLLIRERVDGLAMARVLT